jgi:hypothetical protein
MEKFAYYFRLVINYLPVVIFFVIACWPVLYVLAGIMVILLLFSYALQWQKIGDELPKKEV